MRGTAGRSDRRRRRTVVRASVAMVALAAGVLSCHGGGSQPASAAPSANAAIAHVSTVRRGLRSACKKLTAAARGEGDRVSQMAAAAQETGDAGAHWSALLEASGGSAPEPYAAYPQWVRVSEEIRAGIAEMEERIAADDAEGAYRACGRNCGRFVTMDEAAGLRLAANALFRFRQRARPLAEPVARGDLASVGAALPALLALRDSALIWPAAGPGPAAERGALLREFGEEVDRFGSAVRAAAGVTASYDRMMERLERAYDAVL